jgi:hypothetical protein
MAAQYGKMVMQDFKCSLLILTEYRGDSFKQHTAYSTVTPPHKDAGCRPALGRDDGKLCGMSSRRGIEKVKMCHTEACLY